MNDIQKDIPYATLENEMAFIMPAPKDDWLQIKRKMTSAFHVAARNIKAQSGLQLIMGVGSPVENIVYCNKSFREASKALMLARQREEANDPVYWEEMGAYKFLAPIQNSRESQEFVDEYLGKLMGLDDDEDDKDSLLGTLFCIINNNWHLKAAAAQMGLHYNTMKYRCRKIGEIIGMDMDSPSVRTNLSFAMELYKLNKIGKEHAKWEE